MSGDYDSGCGGSIATVQDDGRILVNGVYTSRPVPLSALGCYKGESPTPRGMEQHAPLIWHYSNLYNLPAHLIGGMFGQESHGQTNAMNYGDNPHGAGISQVTALGAKQGHSDYDIAHDPELAISLGIEWFVKTCWGPWGPNIVKAVASYNAGGPHCGTLSGHAPNQWNLRTFGDYVTPIIAYSNGLIDSGTFDPRNNPEGAPPAPPPDGIPGGDLVLGNPTIVGVITGLFLIGAAFGGAYLLERGA